jgi:hypothetical protein
MFNIMRDPRVRYGQSKSLSRDQFTVSSRSEAISRLTKMVEELPHEHSILVTVSLLCAGEKFLLGGPNDPQLPSCAEQLEPLPPHAHRSKYQKKSRRSSGNLPENHSEGI